MGISGIDSSASHAALTQAQASIASVARANDVARNQGDAIVEMLQVATDIAENLGKPSGSHQIDVKA